MITPVSGFGAQIKVGDGASPEVFTLIEGVRNLQGPTMDREIIDATHHASTGETRQKVTSFKEPGTVTFDLLFDGSDDTHQLLFELWASGELTNFEQIMPDAGTQEHAYAGYVKSLNQSAPINHVLSVAVTIEVSGAITTTYAP